VSAVGEMSYEGSCVRIANNSPGVKKDVQDQAGRKEYHEGPNSWLEAFLFAVRQAPLSVKQEAEGEDTRGIRANLVERKT